MSRPVAAPAGLKSIKTATGDISLITEAYEIVSLEPTEPPGGMEGTGWHCYIIAQGDNRIRGYQQDNIQSVTRSVEEIVARLNERRFGKSGRVHLTMPAQGKKTAGK